VETGNRRLSTVISSITLLEEMLCASFCHGFVTGSGRQPTG
jgi:hypothetical protein